MGLLRCREPFLRASVTTRFVVLRVLPRPVPDKRPDAVLVAAGQRGDLPFLQLLFKRRAAVLVLAAAVSACTGAGPIRNRATDAGSSGGGQAGAGAGGSSAS